MKDWKLKFREAFPEMTGIVKSENNEWVNKQRPYVENWIEDLLAEVRKETAEDICKMTDKIELSYRDSTLEEWKAWKHIRNAIRDKYDPDGFQKTVKGDK